MAAAPLAVGAASRPYPGETLNGDNWVVAGEQDWYRIVVVDALGHGPEAAAVAAGALAALARHPRLDVTATLQACHEALRGTRGAAISVACVDLAESRLTYAGLGNVEARLWQGNQPHRLVAYRGIVGVTMRTIRAFSFALEPDWLLLLHTDGVSNRFGDQLPGLAHRDPQGAAAAVLAGWGRQTDDATVVVVCSG